ncbi:Protein of unknown function [Pyronema omphalodes CBS 100304]|uniref:Uncharacterized protein n=1 Tax=Pyronema omphalodes (strain CBS 100304) TaxID=1076935 RepID=U4LGV7_PYROM|nr:Protein of unknown function [Pyronema omphalodes CBS 100304]
MGVLGNVRMGRIRCPPRH